MKAVTMSSKSSPTLTKLHTDQTRRMILEAAVRILEENEGSKELTVRDAAKQAGISERTMFRYYATRDEFLDAVALATSAAMKVPAPPANLEELLAAPRDFFTAFEAKSKLTKAALHSDVFFRIQKTVAAQRWIAIRKVIDKVAPRAPEKKRKLIAANIRFLLSASTWHYYRSYFKFTLEETIESVELAIRQAIDDLR